MAMFVLVVDTSLMNVSISAVVHDLGTTVSAVQSAIALEALVSAAFILIGSKVGDLIGRKKAYVLGLLAYAVGALAMTLAQSVTAIVVFWAVIGGLGASLLLPAMQSLIHGNFEGAAQKRVYALVGASAAIAAAVGPLLGGFITTFLSWRVGFALEVVIIAIVLSGIGRVHDVPYTGPRHIDPIGAVLSVLGMGGIVLGVLVWQEGGEAVGAFLAVGAVALGSLSYWLVHRKRDGKPALIDPDLFRSKMFRLRGDGADDAADRPGRRDDRAADLPADGAGVQRDADGSVDRPALAHDVRGGVARRQEGGKPAPERGDPGGLRAPGGRGWRCSSRSCLGRTPAGTSSCRLVVAGAGLGLLVSQLNNYTLSPIDEERVSEAAGVNSASGSFGLSFGLAFAGAIMLGTLAFTFTNMAESSAVFTPTEQQRVADGLEEDAEIMSNSQLEELLVGQPQDIQAEIIRINTDAREISLQVALLVPLLAALFGLFTAFRMGRLPDPAPSGSAEGVVLG